MDCNQTPELSRKHVPRQKRSDSVGIHAVHIYLPLRDVIEIDVCGGKKEDILSRGALEPAMRLTSGDREARVEGSEPRIREYSYHPASDCDYAPRSTIAHLFSATVARFIALAFLPCATHGVAGSAARDLLGRQFGSVTPTPPRSAVITRTQRTYVRARRLEPAAARTHFAYHRAVRANPRISATDPATYLPTCGRV